MTMSPINQRRWNSFKANRRGYVSLWLFLALFTLTLFAEFVANDKPIIMSMDDNIYFPVVFTYTEKELGGVLETEAYYKDPFILDRIDNGGWALWPPIKFSYNSIDWELKPPYPHPVSYTHLTLPTIYSV